MSKKAAIPDAWDDDWESQADKSDAVAETPKVEEPVKVSKAERLAKHAEINKKIWEDAEEPETFHFLAAHDNVPLKSDFKPALKVLSRKPAPKLKETIDPLTGLAKMTLDDDEDEMEQKIQLTPEELRARAQKEREEKQKRYDEARARILGTASGSSTPGTVTPPSEDTKSKRTSTRGRGNQRQDSRPTSQPNSKELFDPHYTPKPGVKIQKRNLEEGGVSLLKDEDQRIRAPRGPDSSGRGGFGFANKGGMPS